MRDGEESGFKLTDTARTETSPPPGADPARLKRSGYIKTSYQPLLGNRHRAGVTAVDLFKTEAGAREWFEYEMSDEGLKAQIPDVEPKRFSVVGVPGARGWTGDDLHGNPIGHVLWVQGRCILVLGNEGEGNLVKPLSTGAKAIYERTNGVCP